MSAFTTIQLYHNEPLICEAGEVIFKADEVGEVMYALLKGNVGLWVDDTLVESISAGDVFGEGALVQPGHTRATRAIAETPCELVTLNQTRFLFLCENTPMFAVEVMRSFSDRLRLLKIEYAKLKSH